jgi:hydroxymethylpyrimidine pyrophosphatase-like HAD family hydrolase
MGLSDPLICTNGAQLLGSPVGPIWIRHTIPQEVAADIASFSDNNRWSLITTVDDIDYLHPDPSKPSSVTYNGRKIVDRNIDGIVGPPVRILTTHPEAITGLVQYCSEHLPNQVKCVSFKDKSLGIFPSGVDKGTSLDELLRRINITKDEVLSIGDDECDLAMIQNSGIFVAMGNASDSIKNKAHSIAPPNDFEGVAWAVAKYVFNEHLID